MNNLEKTKSDVQSAEKDLSKVADGIFHTKIIFVNAYFVETPENTPGSFVIIDTGLPFAATRVKHAVENRYGAGAKPTAIVLTHGHFDHAGSALSLAEDWDVPIYAHRLEMPYLTGKSDYPPQDPTVGGAIAQMSRMFPHGGYDFGSRVSALPDGGDIAEMHGWKFLHTPGHTAGHISLWREADRTLLAGDALTTMNLDSWVSQITEKKEFCSPPKPFTTDWQAARRSVELLAELEPRVVAAGHGEPIDDADTAEQLKELARNFDAPRKGRYVTSPAITDESGVVAVPPPATDNVKIAAAGIAAGILVTAMMRRTKKGEK
ncbi:MAG: MBL fold metallo-hydrolase [Acidobacteriota bacterium]|nr:MBL fold metallo-hydrolase [Acidobacteriota bacterium]